MSGAAWSDNVYISVTEPVEPLGSTLYLFGQLRSSGSVGDRYTRTRIPHQKSQKSQYNISTTT